MMNNEKQASPQLNNKPVAKNDTIATKIGVMMWKAKFCSVGPPNLP